MTTVRYKFERENMIIQGPYLRLEIVGGYADIDIDDQNKIALARQYNGKPTIPDKPKRKKVSDA